MRKGPSMRVGEGGGAIDLMIEVMSCYLFLSSSAPLGSVWRWLWRMVHVSTTSSDDSFTESGCVGGCACGGVRLALPDDWRRNALVDGGFNTGGVAA